MKQKDPNHPAIKWSKITSVWILESDPNPPAIKWSKITSVWILESDPNHPAIKWSKITSVWILESDPNHPAIKWSKITSVWILESDPNHPAIKWSKITSIWILESDPIILQSNESKITLIWTLESDPHHPVIKWSKNYVKSEFWNQTQIILHSNGQHSAVGCQMESLRWGSQGLELSAEFCLCSDSLTVASVVLWTAWCVRVDSFLLLFFLSLWVLSCMGPSPSPVLSSTDPSNNREVCRGVCKSCTWQIPNWR